MDSIPARGHRRLSSRITGGSRPLTRDWQVPMRSLPPGRSGSWATCWARPTASNTSSARGRNRSPAWVSLTRLPMRSNKGDTQLLLQLLKLHGDSGLGIA